MSDQKKTTIELPWTPKELARRQREQAEFEAEFVRVVGLDEYGRLLRLATSCMTTNAVMSALYHERKVGEADGTTALRAVEQDRDDYKLAAETEAAERRRLQLELQDTQRSLVFVEKQFNDTIQLVTEQRDLIIRLRRPMMA